VRGLRRRGFIGSIAALTAADDAAHRQACSAAGCNRFLPKPITHQRLLHLVETTLSRPVFSTMSYTDYTDVVERFVAGLPTRVGELEAASADTNWNALVVAVQTLKGEGGACGFESITEAAAYLEQAIGEQLAVDEIRERLDALLRICSAARVPQTRIGDLGPPPNGA